MLSAERIYGREQSENLNWMHLEALSIRLWTLRLAIGWLSFHKKSPFLDLEQMWNLFQVDIHVFYNHAMLKLWNRWTVEFEYIIWTGPQVSTAILTAISVCQSKKARILFLGLLIHSKLFQWNGFLLLFSIFDLQTIRYLFLQRRIRQLHTHFLRTRMAAAF